MGVWRALSVILLHPEPSDSGRAGVEVRLPSTRPPVGMSWGAGTSFSAQLWGLEGGGAMGEENHMLQCPHPQTEVEFREGPQR